MNNITSFTGAQVNLESIGARIKQVRKTNHLTVEQFAEEMGVSENAVYKWQRGETVPDIVNFGNLSTRYGVSLDYLILGRGDSDELSPLPFWGHRGQALLAHLSLIRSQKCLSPMAPHILVKLFF